MGSDKDRGIDMDFNGNGSDNDTGIDTDKPRSPTTYRCTNQGTDGVTEWSA